MARSSVVSSLPAPAPVFLESSSPGSDLPAFICTPSIAVYASRPEQAGRKARLPSRHGELALDRLTRPANHQEAHG